MNKGWFVKWIYLIKILFLWFIFFERYKYWWLVVKIYIIRERVWYEVGSDDSVMEDYKNVVFII